VMGPGFSSEVVTYLLVRLILALRMVTQIVPVCARYSCSASIDAAAVAAESSTFMPNQQLSASVTEVYLPILS